MGRISLKNSIAKSGPPPLSLQILMCESAPTKVQNMIETISAVYIAAVEMITRKN